MSESIEHALEHMVAAMLFCAAIVMLFLLHDTFLQQVQLTGRSPERLILVEQREGKEWSHLDEQ